MENETNKPKFKKAKKLLKILGIALLILTNVVFFVDWMWVSSGSNKWELQMDENGIQVYTLKAPGDRMVKFKAVGNFDHSLSQFAAPHIIDHNLRSCKEWFPNCTGCDIIRPFDEEKLYDVSLWTIDLPAPFTTREILINTLISQDENKVLTVDVMAAPNVVPANEGTVRIERMHNVWKMTPLPGGQTKCEFIQDLSLGGFFPYFLINMAGVEENYKLFNEQLPVILNKYEEVSFSFIKELGHQKELVTN